MNLATQTRVNRILARCNTLTPGQLAALSEIVEYEFRQHDVETREALEAARIFLTPLEKRRNWNEFKQDAADRITAIVGLPT